jgi:hypothetical protein
MSTTLERTESSTKTKHLHEWLRRLSVGYAGDDTSAAMDEFADRLLDQFTALEHGVFRPPEGKIDVLFATGECT